MLKYVDDGKLIGTLKVTSGKVIVSDPCYIPGSLNGRCTAVVDVPNGEHPCFIGIVDEGSWGNRVATLTLFIKDGVVSRQKEIANLCVDSGQMSFMDESLLPEWGSDPRDNDPDFYGPDDWRTAPNGYRYNARTSKDFPDYKGVFNYYGICCETLDNQGGSIENKMVASQTGYGDGGYPLMAYYNSKDELLWLTVEFIGEEEDETCYSCGEPYDWCHCDEGEEENEIEDAWEDEQYDD